MKGKSAPIPTTLRRLTLLPGWGRPGQYSQLTVRSSMLENSQIHKLPMVRAHHPCEALAHFFGKEKCFGKRLTFGEIGS